MLPGYLLHILAFGGSNPDNARDESLQGSLVVCFQDHSRMAEPFQNFDDQGCHVVIFINAFARYDVREDGLRLGASQDKAFYQLAGFSGDC